MFESTNTSSIICLSTKLLATNIFPFLTPFDIGHVLQVNKKFRQVVDNFLNIVNVVNMMESWINDKNTIDRQVFYGSYNAKPRIVAESYWWTKCNIS